jgi:hypothetical protein
MLRPSALGIGQLPFETVLTAGSNLQGIDQLLQPVAQRSFKYLVIGVILGAIAGLIIGSFAQRPIARRPSRISTSTTGVFCANCGTTIPDSTSYCPRCGFKRGSISPR